MFETTNQMSQYQSHSLRPNTKSLGLSLKDETGLEKFQPWSDKYVDHSILIIVFQGCLTLLLEPTNFQKV